MGTPSPTGPGPAAGAAEPASWLREGLGGSGLYVRGQARLFVRETGPTSSWAVTLGTSAWRPSTGQGKPGSAQSLLCSDHTACLLTLIGGAACDRLVIRLSLTSSPPPPGRSGTRGRECRPRLSAALRSGDGKGAGGGQAWTRAENDVPEGRAEGSAGDPVSPVFRPPGRGAWAAGGHRPSWGSPSARSHCGRAGSCDSPLLTEEIPDQLLAGPALPQQCPRGTGTQRRGRRRPNPKQPLRAAGQHSRCLPAGRGGPRHGSVAPQLPTQQSSPGIGADV